MSDESYYPPSRHRSRSRDHRRRHSARRRPHHYHHNDHARPIDIRVGSRCTPGRYLELRATGPRDVPRFEALIEQTRRLNPTDPVLLAINGYSPWLEELLGSCFAADGSDEEREELTRAVYQTDQLWFPERCSKYSKYAPWTFIVDEMNLPDVFWWTFGELPPSSVHLSSVNSYRLRLGVWTCREGAYVYDRRIPVTMLFTQPTRIQENIVKHLAFQKLYEDEEYGHQRNIEEAVTWAFLRLFTMLTDWHNITKEAEKRLQAASVDSERGQFPVKYRTRTMHREVDRIYDLMSYLAFHSRSFKKLNKLKGELTKDLPKGEHPDPVWGEVDDVLEDLGQAKDKLDALKERFNNLIELEFNISNATQSENAQFLSAIATLFLPISYLASIWGITTITFSPLSYVYVAVPVLLVSIAFIPIFRKGIRRYQKAMYKDRKERPDIQPEEFALLGEEIPNATAPTDISRSKTRGRFDGEKQVLQPPGTRNRSRSRSRKRSR
ncbi:MAG: hypothetical protein M1822_002394 [Bathelium mastoideum]|nr:MAG: hypothetical protein M1822_002394 [Bathelium mastoideum]